jgi:hypothetical protein
MARASEVSSSTSSLPKSTNASMNYLASLRVKEEIVALDNYMTDVQGEQKYAL